MSASPAPIADYVLSISANTGYSNRTEGKCTPEQYGDAFAVLHSKPTKGELALVEVLRDVRKVLATAIEANVDIEGFDVSQHVTIKKLDEAIEKVEAKTK